MRDYSNATIYHAQNSPRRAKKPPRRHNVLPAILFLLTLVLAAVVGFIVLRSLGNDKPKPAAVGSRAILLDDIATVTFETACMVDDPKKEKPEETVQPVLDELLDRVQAMGGDTLFWTGRDSQKFVLFRVKSKEGLPFEPAIAETDSFFHKFDPTAALLDAAAQRGISLMLLPTDEAGDVLTAEQIADTHPDVLAAAEKYGLQLCAAGEPDADGITVYRTFDSQLAPTGLAFARCDASPARLLTALDTGEYSRLVLGDYTLLTTNPSVTILLARHQPDDTAEQTLPDLLAAMGGREITEELALAYPTDTVYTDLCFLMGTSDPDLPLTISGGTVGDTPMPVERYGTKGVWGKLVSLSTGENHFTLQQEGGQTRDVTVKCRISSGGGSGGGSGSSGNSDGSVPAVWGQQLRISGTACASALNDYRNPDSINATLYEGATAAVYDSVRFMSGGRYTYAYRLVNGTYVLAKNADLLDVNTPAARFKGMEVGFEAETNCTTITLRGGTPAVTHQWEDNAIAFTFLTASYEGDIPVPDRFITEYSAENAGDGASFTMGLRFAEDDPLYGWSVSYDTAANTTTLYLKHRPKLSDASTGPLTGVRILLDAGHGDNDNGAMGSAGINAPLEKDVNLAETLAAKYRLEELGATVLLVRGDDTFYTLNERLNMVRDLRPDFFIALHHNSAALTSDLNNHGGTEAYWFFTEGKLLAENLVNNVCSATGRARRGVFYDYYFVTRSNICPSVLMESGFMTDPGEYENCADVSTIWNEAGAISLSVLEYMAALEQ